MSQKLPTNEFKWVKHVDVEYPKTLFNNRKDFPFLPEKKRLKKLKNLFVVQKTKKICYSHKDFKTSIRSWVKTKKGSQSN